MGRTSVGNAPLVTWPIDGSDINSAPTNLIPASAMQFARVEKTAFGLKIGDTPVTTEVWLFTAENNGTLEAFHGSVTVPGSSASVTLDLKKNGTTVLSAPLTLTNASAARTSYSASFAGSTSYSAGDEFTALLTVSSSTGMQGVKCRATAVEQGQPI